MRNRKIQVQHRHLDDLFKRSKIASGNDIYMLSHWARYLCVLTSGFLENAIIEIYGDFVDNAPKPVANYARSQLSKIRNPNEQKFYEIAFSFNPSWAEDLRTFTDDSGRKDAIDSIINVRHQVAHGRDTNITIARLQEYYRRAVEVVDFIEDQCDS